MTLKTLNLLILATLFSASALSQSNSFSGRAAAVQASVTAVGQPVITTSLTDTGYLPSTGGGTTLAGADADLLKILTIHSSNGSTSGVGNTSSSAAGVDQLNITVGGVTVSASAVQALAQASCPGGTPSGGSTITDLMINGVPIAISGDPNQTVPVVLGDVTLGTVVINEQAIDPYAAQVRALHVRLTLADLTKVDVAVGFARAGIGCSEAPAVNIFDSYSTGVWVYQKSEPQGLVTTLAATDNVSGTGGQTSASVQGASLLGGLLTTGAITSTASGGVPANTPDSTQASSDVANFGVNVAGVLSISATGIRSNTQCQCSTQIASCSATSEVGTLSISIPLLPRIDVPITGEPNQVVTLPLGLGTIILNERQTNTIGFRGRALATAIRLNLNVLGLSESHIYVAESNSAVSCRFMPSSSSVKVIGRVVSDQGEPLSNVRVGLRDENGSRRYAMSNGFGYFQFSEVATGHTYSVAAKGRTYYFPAQTLTVKDEITDLQLVGINMGRQASKSAASPPVEK